MQISDRVCMALVEHGLRLDVFPTTLHCASSSPLLSIPLTVGMKYSLSPKRICLSWTPTSSLMISRSGSSLSISSLEISCISSLRLRVYLIAENCLRNAGSSGIHPVLSHARQAPYIPDRLFAYLSPSLPQVI